MDVDIDKLIDAVEVLHSINNNKEDSEKHWDYTETIIRNMFEGMMEVSHHIYVASMIHGRRHTMKDIIELLNIIKTDYSLPLYLMRRRMRITKEKEGKKED